MRDFLFWWLMFATNGTVCFWLGIAYQKWISKSDYTKAD